MCEQCEQLTMEPVKVRRIPVEEMQKNCNVFVERVEELMKNILMKYELEFQVDAFTWKDGIANATIKLVSSKK